MLLRRKQKLRLKSCHHYNIKQALGGVCNSQLILLQDERWFGKFRVLSSFLNKILQQLLMRAYTHVLTPRPLSLSVSLFLILSPLSPLFRWVCLQAGPWYRVVVGNNLFWRHHTYTRTHTYALSLSLLHTHAHTHTLEQASHTHTRTRTCRDSLAKAAGHKNRFPWQREKRFLQKKR